MLGWMEHMHDFRVELNAEKICCLTLQNYVQYIFYKLFAQLVLHVSIVGHRNCVKKCRDRHPTSGMLVCLWTEKLRNVGIVAQMKTTCRKCCVYIFSTAAKEQLIKISA